MKRIVICCDGTWNDLEMRYITNVGRLVQALLPEAGSGASRVPQLIYYDDGVGAESAGVRRLIEGAFGRGIDTIIYEAYRFLCINYEPGDEVCLFGFSRGAFTVRSIAGMISRVGLVPREQLKYVPEALTHYRSKSPSDQAAFKKARARDIPIAVLGCWDTVGALGIPDKVSLLSIDKLTRKKYQFHDLSLATGIKLAVHALALDEHRKEFDATLMHKSKAGQKLVQTWFPGDHGCVGGGLWEKRGLSNHTLRWMVDTVRAHGVDLAVDWKRLHDDAMVDHSIFFDNGIAAIYGTRQRRLRDGVVAFGDLDDTARRRWAEDGAYRYANLAKRFRQRLDTAAKQRTDVRVVPTADTALDVGDAAFVQVFAREADNRSRILVRQGERYQLEVARTQVWKDGDLDPCDILGWNTKKSGADAKRPWENGEPADHNALSTRLIRLGGRKKLVQNADWFQLVVGVDGDGFEAPTIALPASETEPYRLSYEPGADGRLSLAANDLYSRIGVIDKYDNNAGWIWVKVTRTA